jgi:hypothetical protein
MLFVHQDVQQPGVMMIQTVSQAMGQFQRQQLDHNDWD